jgi:FkbM family methyltransferase
MARPSPQLSAKLPRWQLLAEKLRAARDLDLILARAPELSAAERLRFAIAKYLAIGFAHSRIRYLGHTFHYDNRLTPAILPGYLAEIRDLDAAVDLAQLRTILDIGANIGQFGGTLAWRFPDLRVWSFEPNPVAGELLRANASDTPHWTVVPFGVADEDAEVDLWFVPGKSAQGSVHHDNAVHGLFDQRVQRTTVPLRALTRAVASELDLPTHVDLIKVDVEGAEAGALEGLRELTWSHLMLEISLERNEGLSLEDAIAMIARIWGLSPAVTRLELDAQTHGKDVQNVVFSAAERRTSLTSAERGGGGEGS